MSNLPIEKERDILKALLKVLIERERLTFGPPSVLKRRLGMYAKETGFSAEEVYIVLWPLLDESFRESYPAPEFLSAKLQEEIESSS